MIHFYKRVCKVLTMTGGQVGLKHVLQGLMIFSWTYNVNSGNILMYLPVASRSHVSTWEPLATGLAESGHNVLFVTLHRLPYHPNLEQVVIGNPEFKEFEQVYANFVLHPTFTLESMGNLLSAAS